MMPLIQYHSLLKLQQLSSFYSPLYVNNHKSESEHDQYLYQISSHTDWVFYFIKLIKS